MSTLSKQYGIRDTIIKADVARVLRILNMTRKRIRMEDEKRIKNEREGKKRRKVYKGKVVSKRIYLRHESVNAYHLCENKYTDTHIDVAHIWIREMRAIQIVACTYTIMTQFKSKKSRARRRTRELSQSTTGSRIESRYIIIESMVSRNAVDEMSISENHEISIANWHIRILNFSLFLYIFL